MDLEFLMFFQVLLFTAFLNYIMSLAEVDGVYLKLNYFTIFVSSLLFVYSTHNEILVWPKVLGSILLAIVWLIFDNKVFDKEHKVYEKIVSIIAVLLLIMSIIYYMFNTYISIEVFASSFVVLSIMFMLLSIPHFVVGVFEMTQKNKTRT